MFACLITLPLFVFAQPRERKLVWSDEFNYIGQPDSSKWTADIGGHGFGNNESQFYTTGRLENARVENGVLVIEARREKWPADEVKQNDYTSARLVTKNKGDWQYGRIDVRAKLPSGRGTWPAIWMLASVPGYNWPDDGEIDIMEHVGYNPAYVHASVHCTKYYHKINTQKTDTTIVPDFSTAFHDYSLEWTKEYIKVLVDGKEFFTFNNEHSGYDGWPFDNRFHLILNLAVGGFWGGAKGIDENIWPRRMEVDYVRVYQ
ncbi:MAG: glycoside hydrolase family 16 protein [Chitinophagaceae bacterium]